MFIRNVVKGVEYSLEKCRRLKYSMRTFQAKYNKDKEEQIKLKLTGSVKHIKLHILRLTSKHYTYVSKTTDLTFL